MKAPPISRFARMLRRLRAVLRRDALDREVSDEMRFHLQMEADDLRKLHGLNVEEAQRQALVAFGGTTRFIQEHREARGTGWLGETWQDVRYAVRSLKRSPGFSLSAILILALGIGATTAAFSAVNAILRDPEYDDVALIYQHFSPTNRGTLSVVDFEAVRAQQRSFSAVGAIRWGEAAISTEGAPEQARAGWATSGVFAGMRTRVQNGRVLAPGDDPVGAPPVAVVSHARAEKAFGGANAAIGRTIRIDDVSHTVVGVLPPYVLEVAGVRADVWAVLQLKQPGRRGPFGLRVVGRVRDGVSLAAAESDLAGISQRIFPLWATSFQDSTARLAALPLRTALLGNATPMLRAFGAGVLLVLLIAVINVASLMLVRAIGRSREVALRATLGAGRSRLLRLLVTESLVLAGAGAVAGIALGAAGLRALIHYGPRLPHLASAQLDDRAVAFAAVLALVAGMAVGIYPALMLVRGDNVAGGHAGNRTAGPGRRTHALRSAFVVAQFALALPLLAIAGLLLNSFIRLQQVHPGFESNTLLTARVSLPSARYDSDSLVERYWRQAVPLLGDIAGVRAVGLGSVMPPDARGSSYNNFDLLDRPVAPGSNQHVSPWPIVDREYFTALGLELIDGRFFAPADTGAEPVVIVSLAWAQRYFPDGSAVGRKLISGGCTTCPATTVVGIVADVRYEGLGGTADAVYSPLSEGFPRQLNVFVRTERSPSAVAEKVRSSLGSLDPGLPLDDVAPMDRRLYASIAQPRNWVVLLGGFAASALLLAAAGIFGMLSHAVSSRRREIGVRMALGARQRSVVRMIVQRGLTHALIGTVIGTLIAIAATRAIASALFQVTPSDPLTLVGVAMLLLGVAIIACWLPARRAAAIDPAETLRCE